MVQGAWLRWSGADRAEVREPRGYLVRITIRPAIDRSRHVQSRNEAYAGPWLPEPRVTDFGDAVPDTAERALLADSVSLAVLMVLSGNKPDSVFQLDVVDGRIQRIYIIRNPEKLLSLSVAWRLSYVLGASVSPPKPPFR